jgi:hypothetical protein
VLRKLLIKRDPWIYHLQLSPEHLMKEADNLDRSKVFLLSHLQTWRRKQNWWRALEPKPRDGDKKAWTIFLINGVKTLHLSRVMTKVATKTCGDKEKLCEHC